MSRKHSAPLLAFLFLVLAINGFSYTNDLEPTDHLIEVVQIGDTNACESKRGIVEMALQQFSSGDYNQSVQARKSLIKIASVSNVCKQLVVKQLMEAMDQPNLDFEKQPTNYYLWREGAEILGQLRATEALDLLISHLDLTNGFHSNSMVFQPAMLGVSQMGTPAIPKLSIALQQNRNPRIRMAAAYCLTEIGGPLAMNALRDAQQSESSSCAVNFIRISLSTFTYHSKKGTSFDNAAPQATLSARQNWLEAFQCTD